MTPIQTLLSLHIADAQIARRLRVSQVTVSRWRRSLCVPSPHSQLVARAYLAELSKQIAATLAA